MKRQIALLLAMALLLAVCTACGGGQSATDEPSSADGSVSVADTSGGEAADAAEVEAVLEQFLTGIYTTDSGGRYTELTTVVEAMDSAYASAEESAAYEAFPPAVVEAYYGDLASLMTEDLYEKLVQNRIPYKYDALYIDTPAMVQDVALTAQEDGYSYTVTLQIGGQTETRSGELRWEEQDSAVLVSSFYEAD